MMMETLSQAFVVAPSIHRSQHPDHEEESEEEEEEEYEEDDDSASFYDEDDQSFDSEEEDEEEEEEDDEDEDEDEDDDEESEGSLEQGGLFGTAKYFSGSANLEPQMMGFSDSFVTDGDCSECVEDLCENDLSSPNASPNTSGDLSPNSKELAEASVHEDVLSFDMMLGKRQMSQASLATTNSGGQLAYEQPELVVVQTGAAPSSSYHDRKPSRTPAGQQQKRAASRSRSTSRSRSRSASTSTRRRSTSRSSSEGHPAQPELPPTLMPMPHQDDDDDEDDEQTVEDMFSILAVASTCNTKVLLEKQQHAQEKQAKQQQLAADSTTPSTDQRLSPQQPRRKHKKGNSSSKEDRSGRSHGSKGRSSHQFTKKKKKKKESGTDSAPQLKQRRSSIQVKQHRDHHAQAAHPVEPPTPRSTKRRGSIQVRRQSHRMPDTSNATNTSNNSESNNNRMRRRQSGDHMDSSNTHTYNQQQPRLPPNQPRLQRVDSTGKNAAARRATIATPVQRRRGSYRGLVPPELIAEQLLADEPDEDKTPDPELANGLRKSQSRNTRLGRRRSSINLGNNPLTECISKSEVVKSSRRPSETAAGGGAPMARSANERSSRRQQMQKGSGDRDHNSTSQRHLKKGSSQRQLGPTLQRHASVGTVSTQSSSSTETSDLVVAAQPNANNTTRSGAKDLNNVLMGTSPGNAKAIRRMSRSADRDNSARDVVRGERAAGRMMSNRDRIRRHLSCEAINHSTESSGGLEDEQAGAGADGAAEGGAMMMTRQDSRRERPKSAWDKSQRRKITRCKSEPAEKMHDIMYADIDDDTVAAMHYIEGAGDEVFEDEEEDDDDNEYQHPQRRGSPKSVRGMQKSDSVRIKSKTKKAAALQRSETADSAKLAKNKAKAAAATLKF